jgi:hypothetical protein
MLMQMQCNYGAKHLRCYSGDVGQPIFDHLNGLLSILFLFCFEMNVVLHFFYSFWPTYGVFPCISRKISESTKTMEMVSLNPLSMLFFGEFYINVGGVRYEVRTANKLPHT